MIIDPTALRSTFERATARADDDADEQRERR